MYVYVVDPACLALVFDYLCKTDEWIAPLDKDDFRPEILGSHAFSQFDSHRAVLFGGNGSLIYSNNAYIFDLETRVRKGLFGYCLPTVELDPQCSGTISICVLITS